MSKRKRTKFIHEGMYVAEVDVELIEDSSGWSPYLSLEDAYRLDDVREALRSGNLGMARRNGRIYELRPVMEDVLYA
jgi:hypothetical protein